MSDPINDRHIEELLNNLDGGYWPEKHAALTALIAERDALRKRVAELENPIRNPLSSTLELKLEQTLDEMQKGATDGK